MGYTIQSYGELAVLGDLDHLVYLEAAWFHVVVALFVCGELKMQSAVLSEFIGSFQIKRNSRAPVTRTFVSPATTEGDIG